MVNRIAAVAFPAPASARPGTRWSLAALLVTVLGTAGGVAVLVAVPDLPPGLRDGLLQALATTLPYGLVGAFLLARRPDLPFGWLLAGAAASQVVMMVGIGLGALGLQRGHTGLLVTAGLSLGSLGFVPIAVQGLVNVRFPSGRPATRQGRWLEQALIAGTALVILGGFLGGGTLRDVAPGRDLRNPVTAGTWVGHAADAVTVLGPFVVLGGLVAGIGVVVRCVRGTGIERQQLKWRAAGVVLALALFPLAVTERLGGVVNAADSTVFVATLAIPVLRYRLWAIDTIIRRSAAYAAVTVVLVAGYALIAGAGATLASERVGFGVAGGAVAIGFTPLRRRSQRLVDRLFYGERNDPYQVLSDVGRRLDAAAAPGEILPAVAAAVAGTLRLPYVRIERPTGRCWPSRGSRRPGSSGGRWRTRARRWGR